MSNRVGNRRDKLLAAADWLGGAAQSGTDGRWMLWVDEFDPHEPFDTPEPWVQVTDGRLKYARAPEGTMKGCFVWR